MAISPVVNETDSAATISVRVANSRRVDSAAKDKESPITACNVLNASMLTGPAATLIPSGTVSCIVGEFTDVFPPTCTSTVSLRSTTVDPAIAISALPPAIAPNRPAALSEIPRPVIRSISSATESVELPVTSKPTSVALSETTLCTATVRWSVLTSNVSV